MEDGAVAHIKIEAHTHVHAYDGKVGAGESGRFDTRRERHTRYGEGLGHG